MLLAAQSGFEGELVVEFDRHGFVVLRTNDCTAATIAKI
jgi:hypothetical protein